MAFDGDQRGQSILTWAGRLVEANAESRRRHGVEPDDRPTPDPYALYPSGLRATMPEPAKELSSALSLGLTRAEREALDPLCAWRREGVAGDNVLLSVRLQSIRGIPRIRQWSKMNDRVE